MAVRRKKKATRKKAGRKKATRRRSAPLEMIISKSRTKNAITSCKVAGDFYAALDAKVRELLAQAEERAHANKRGTVRPQDL